MVSVADRRRHRLLEKSEFRPMQKVMAKAPIGAATLQSAPKLSDFRDLPLSERVKAHEKALQDWMNKNLSEHSIQEGTRVQMTLRFERIRMHSTLSRSRVLQLYDVPLVCV